MSTSPASSGQLDALAIHTSPTHDNNEQAGQADFSCLLPCLRLANSRDDARPHEWLWALPAPFHALSMQPTRCPSMANASPQRHCARGSRTASFTQPSSARCHGARDRRPFISALAGWRAGGLAGSHTTPYTTTRSISGECQCQCCATARRQGPCGVAPTLVDAIAGFDRSRVFFLFRCPL